MAGSASTPEARSTTETAPTVPVGGGALRRRPDTEQAGRAGEREVSEAATNLASNIDPVNLERDALTELDRSQISRVRSAKQRRSWENHRATPNPMELTFLATGQGQLRERRERGHATQGSISGAEPSAHGAELGADSASGLDPGLPRGAPREGNSLETQAALGAARAARGTVREQGAAVLQARPWVMQARVAVPNEVRARPSDTLDAAQQVASRVAALIHASSIGGTRGQGVGGEPLGGEPGTSGEHGAGSRSLPSGFGPGLDLENDPGAELFTGRLRRRVDQELRDAFPKWAIAAGRSGHVIFEMVVLADGKLAEVRLLRPSGIQEYDGNVVAGLARIASFGPIPKNFGSRARITMSYEALNRIVGLDGPGPGGHAAAHSREP